MSRRPPFGLQPRDARFLAMYLGLGISMLVAVSLAALFPRFLPIIIVAALTGTYFLARWVSSLGSN